MEVLQFSYFRTARRELVRRGGRGCCRRASTYLRHAALAETWFKSVDRRLRKGDALELPVARRRRGRGGAELPVQHLPRPRPGRALSEMYRGQAARPVEPADPRMRVARARALEERRVGSRALVLRRRDSARRSGEAPGPNRLRHQWKSARTRPYRRAVAVPLPDRPVDRHRKRARSAPSRIGMPADGPSVHRQDRDLRTAMPSTRRSAGAIS